MTIDMSRLIQPAQLFMLYSILGYSPEELARMTKRSTVSVVRSIREYEMPERVPTEKDRVLRVQIATLRTKRGDAAAMRATTRLLEAAAGPPIRVMR